MKKSLLGIAVLASTMLLAGCGPSTTSATTSQPATTSAAPAVNKFRSYTGAQFIAEDYSKKTVAYQFVSQEPYEIKEYGIGYHVCINLYTDGSLYLDARNFYSSSSWIYYGAWDVTKDSDGYNQLVVAELFENNGQNGTGTDCTECKKTATLPESSTGTFSWTVYINMAPGQYERTITAIGSKTATYDSFEAFHKAVDIISVKTEFIGTNANGTFRVLGLSNGTANAYYYVTYNGSVVRAGKWEGGKYSNDGVSATLTTGTGYTFDFTSVTNVGAKFTTTIASDGTVAPFTFTAKVSDMSGKLTEVSGSVSKAATIDVKTDGTLITAASSSSSANA